MASGMTTFMVEVGGVSLVPATTARRRLEPIAVAAVTVGAAATEEVAANNAESSRETAKA